MKKSEVQMVVVGRKRENRERRGDQYFVCVRTCVPYQLNMVVGTRVRVRERERERKKKARGAEMMMVVDRGGSLGEGPCHRLSGDCPGGVVCAVCGVPHSMRDFCAKLPPQPPLS